MGCLRRVLACSDGCIYCLGIVYFLFLPQMTPIFTDFQL